MNKKLTDIFGLTLSEFKTVFRAIDRSDSLDNRFGQYRRVRLFTIVFGVSRAQFDRVIDGKDAQKSLRSWENDVCDVDCRPAQLLTKALARLAVAFRTQTIRRNELLEFVGRLLYHGPRDICEEPESDKQYRQHSVEINLARER